MFVIHTLCTNLTPKYDTPVSHLLKGLFKYGRFPIKVDRGGYHMLDREFSLVP